MSIRDFAIGLAMLALVAIIALSGSGLNPWIAAKRANARAAVAEQQAAVETTKAEVMDRIVRSEVTIRTQAQGADYNVQQSQGATQPLPAAVRGSVLAGVDGLRNPAGAGADHPTGEPAEPVR